MLVNTNLAIADYSKLLHRGVGTTSPTMQSMLERSLVLAQDAQSEAESDPALRRAMVELLVNSGELYLDLSNSAQARQNFETALQRLEGTTDEASQLLASRTYYLLGNCLGVQGDHEEEVTPCPTVLRVGHFSLQWLVIWQSLLLSGAVARRALLEPLPVAKEALHTVFLP